MLRTALLGGVLLLSTPAAAQETPPINCMANSPDTMLASDMVDDFLSESGIGTKPEGTQERMAAAGIACATENNISEANAESYFAANLSYMMAGEFRRRIQTIGFDMAPVDTLLVELAAEPGMDIAGYIDSRPGEFDIPSKAAADANGLPHNTVLAWIGGYVGMKLQERQSLARLQAP